MHQLNGFAQNRMDTFQKNVSFSGDIGTTVTNYTI